MWKMEIEGTLVKEPESKQREKKFFTFQFLKILNFLLIIGLMAISFEAKKKFLFPHCDIGFCFIDGDLLGSFMIKNKKKLMLMLSAIKPQLVKAH